MQTTCETLTVIGSSILIKGRIYYLKGEADEGIAYKDYDAFKNYPDKICYIPEYAGEEKIEGSLAVPSTSEDCYTHNMLLELCEGNENLCLNLFYSLDWCYPETKLAEWKNLWIP